MELTTQQLQQQLKGVLVCSTLLLLLLVPTAQAGKPRDESKGKWR
jgi:hypothetical protein